jgi:aryl-alcohol dehydrogenase-like predicted oxidoreductase
MKYRKLGRSGIKVSEIGFGAWTIGLDWWGKKIDDDEAIRMLKRAYDLGINFYETADMYGNGKSEKIVSQAFKDMRDEIVYSTKWGYDMYNSIQIGHNELPQKHNPEFLKFALQQSLNRLQTDYIDVYSLHNPKMDAIKNDNLFAWENEGLLAIEKRNITCIQTVYNLLEQDPGRAFLNAVRKNNNVGIMVRVPDASGVLTGKVNEKTAFDKNDHRSSRKREWILEAMQKVEKLKPIANARGWSISQLAVKFILSQKEISVVLPTVINVEEIERFVEMADGKYLNENEMAEITHLYNNNFYIHKQSFYSSVATSPSPSKS